MTRDRGADRRAPSARGRWRTLVHGLLLAASLAACKSGSDDPCDGVACSSRGFCLDDRGDPYCACIAGFHPVFLACEANDPTERCVGITCSGHGTCRALPDGVTCECWPGFHLLGLDDPRCADLECDLVCVPDRPGEQDAAAEADRADAAEADRVDAAEADRTDVAEADAEGDADGDSGETCVPGCDGGPCGLGEWVTICPGTFLMGSPFLEPGSGPETQHYVELTHRFEILSTEVTQAEFQALMGFGNFSFYECGGDCPVELASWHLDASYCNALSAAAGLPSCYACSGEAEYPTCEPDVAYATPYDCPGYRLPTEAEWEYAARAGTTDATYNGTIDEAHLECEQPNPVLDPIAWFCGNSGETTHPVGLKLPNPWGLYDILGNVREWCGDWASEYTGRPETDPWGPPTGTERVFRGGDWYNGAREARAASRYWVEPWMPFGNIGMRPARTLP